MSYATTRRIGIAVVPPVALAVLLRLPFLDAPLTADEGGYAEVARLWARGARLYREDWVDRPQGLIVAFRASLAVGLSSTVGLRLAAVVVAVAFAVVMLAAGVAVANVATGRMAALLATAAAASPYIGGFTLAGELLAAVFATGSIAAYAAAARTGGDRRLLVLAGVSAGCAFTVKQSAVDALLAVVAAIVLRRGARCRDDAAIVVVAAAAPIALCVLLSGDAGSWYRAVVAYGAHASPGLADRLGLLARSLPAAALALGGLAWLVAVRRTTTPVLLWLWLAGAFVGVCLGGNFHVHYYLQLVPPLALLAAARVTAAGEPRLRAVVVAAAVTVAVAAPLWVLSDRLQARLVWPSDTHLVSDAEVARYVRSRTTPEQSIYVIWAAADLYYLADRRPAYPYLWLRNLETIPGAVASVDRLLAQRVPAIVVEAQPVGAVRRPLATARILRRNYTTIAVVDGDIVLGRRR